MEKEFRVNAVCQGRPDGLTLLIRAASLKSALKKLRYSTEFQLPAAQYYVYETGCYLSGTSITLTPAFVKHLRISQREAELVNGYLQAKPLNSFRMRTTRFPIPLSSWTGSRWTLSAVGHRTEVRGLRPFCLMEAVRNYVTVKFLTGMTVYGSWSTEAGAMSRLSTSANEAEPARTDKTAPTNFNERKEGNENGKYELLPVSQYPERYGRLPDRPPGRRASEQG